MNYEKIYSQLVEKCKVRGLDKSSHEGYYEIHHIVPRCLGGSNQEDNLVMFTAREHVFAHICLWKSYPKHLGIVTAAQMMADTRKHGKLLNTKVLAKLRIESSKLRSLRTEGAGFGETRHINFSGQRFGRLVVQDNYTWHTFPNGQRKAKWECLCDCGNTTDVIVGGLTSGLTTSCGCYRKEQILKSVKKYNVTPAIYRVYINMIGRCYNEKSKGYKTQGSRGIEVCEDWLGPLGPDNFYKALGDAPEGYSLGRFDTTKNYDVGNCAWMPAKDVCRSNSTRNTNTSGRTGVRFDKRREVWLARIGFEGKEYVRQFKTFEEAVFEREQMEIKYLGLKYG